MKIKVTNGGNLSGKYVGGSMGGGGGGGGGNYECIFCGDFHTKGELCPELKKLIKGVEK